VKSPRIQAILFDLDDTLFDHRLCARTALLGLHEAEPCFLARPFSEFEQLHAGFLEELHRRVLSGELSIDEARRRRFRRLYDAIGESADDERVARAAETYRDGYRRIRRQVAGAAELLQLVRARARVGIVSNNLLEEQQDKLRHCGLDGYIDVLVVSEEAGVSKPDPAIFEMALSRLECDPDAAVMIGDSWAADVIGALAAGIRPIWFNPLGLPPPDPDAAVTELRTWRPPEDALTVILSPPFGPGQNQRTRTREPRTRTLEP
jgi:HAD superfamily hydrolase (TIGR01549 family)